MTGRPISLSSSLFTPYADSYSLSPPGSPLFPEPRHPASPSDPDELPHPRELLRASLAALRAELLLRPVEESLRQQQRGQEVLRGAGFRRDLLPHLPAPHQSRTPPSLLPSSITGRSPAICIHPMPRSARSPPRSARRSRRRRRRPSGCSARRRGAWRCRSCPRSGCRDSSRGRINKWKSWKPSRTRRKRRSSARR